MNRLHHIPFYLLVRFIDSTIKLSFYIVKDFFSCSISLIWPLYNASLIFWLIFCREKLCKFVIIHLFLPCNIFNFVSCLICNCFPSSQLVLAQVGLLLCVYVLLKKKNNYTSWYALYDQKNNFGHAYLNLDSRIISVDSFQSCRRKLSQQLFVVQFWIAQIYKCFFF
jgi:hypothetical protein